MTTSESLNWCHNIKKDPKYAGEWLYQNLDLPKAKELTNLAYTVLGKHLFENGYVVFPIYSPEKSGQLVQEFKETELQFPEYKRSSTVLGTKDNPYVLGGFGAYGNPASFHNEFVRNFRMDKIKCIPVLGKMLLYAQKYGKITSAKKYKVANFMDRMCKRPKGTSTSKESYHKDLMPLGRENDISIGGWVQLSKESSYFSCAPKTHSFESLTKKPKNGFATQKNKTCTDEIEVPQGHLLMFFQNLGHCVHATKRVQDSYRLFSVYLLTQEKTHIYNYDTIIENQGVPPLASYQMPPMFSANHGSFWLKKLTIPWSKKTFKPELLVEKIKKDGEVYKVVETPMKSLEEYHLPMYPTYTDYEKEMFVPNNIFHINEHETVKLFFK